SHHFLGNVLVEDFLHGQGDDDFVAALEKRFDLRQRIRRIIERHEEAFLAIFAHHHGFDGVNVRAAHLVLLLDLDRIPAFFQAEFAFLLLARGGAGGDGEDAAIHAHVAHLHLVGDAAEGDDGPVLKFKWRDDAQFLHRPRQVADDEAASGLPGRFAFRQGANVAQAFGHDALAWAKYQCQAHAQIFNRIRTILRLRGTNQLKTISSGRSHQPWTSGYTQYFGS